MFGIPYSTFPGIELGPVPLRTFGLCVAIGIMVGGYVASRYGRRHGISGDDTLGLVIWIVVAGVVGARLTYVATNFDAIDSVVDVFAVWQGGLQFTGGAAVAAVVGAVLVRRRLAPTQRWRFADAAALGLVIGQAIGRIGCIAVGEHFGGTTSAPWGVRWEGGSTREPAPELGTVFHNTAIYEALHLLVLFAVLLIVLRWRELRPGVLVGVFCLWYGAWRFGTDFLRVNDRELFGLTGAQYGTIVLLVIGAWILATTARRSARLAAAGPEAGAPAEQPAATSDKPAEG